MKAVLMSIQPYWVFLIIAKAMGLNIDKEKTIEVRKTFPKDENWNKVVKMYCSKDKKSFAKIPKQYQPFMKQFLGKIIGEFVCYSIDEYRRYPLTTFEGTLCREQYISRDKLKKTCLSIGEINSYLKGRTAYLWHISNLKIYDEPKELSEFRTECKCGCDFPYLYYRPCKNCNKNRLIRPPQSWCYVERLDDAE